MENIMDIEQIQKVIEKTKLFFQEQDILLEEMGSILEELLDCYQSQQKGWLESFTIDSIHNFDIAHKNMSSNIVVLEKNKSKYQETAKIVEGQFSRLDEEI